ncbi:MAG: hypothetical protein A3C79_01235 [Candidatus Taylorbacteria bacterium RIFCSPHIGHO2_02_FULL_45_28]|uniref:Uncharacterized protein n=1 Tax=Candidatus Taylorbacteria bacterium RIFCSPHIGHO2_12_FULL_45_16 TaxID=1802315 RepID=A0A1G2MZR7_9BACT|nr:MAG: hypothetical protein A2830_02490 [Candidatus Taylorbacteria bacterium RIFCSPHIGHO2_01_FULL_44_110]OHA25637.1 MAG: hypothetical protein A3C79_01235 [Candidatus Taylorbacteria bacterium RIFCSPHIGHO2_02_FULL_45_28]OHA29303.1 MAG: hypothetical protein A3F51_01700 [Candidatus Taylorbacteria bacterium RIFCSPHIGHO2_12_FULL_45_16]OHA33525.1 MAG: hypothetical protein A3A23_02580 [Candidatus Taylorbacteria bacterium RIFCSPLOWO2_01_FULL_45_59]OHA39149.1 MAG: hypothetical protein A3I98_00930 [Candi
MISPLSKKTIKTVANWFQSHTIHIGLIATLILFILYLFYKSLRVFILNENIDPNFIIGFLTVIALLLSLIQSSNDKRYTYNFNLVNSIEEKGLAVIGKLLTMRAKSFAMLGNLKTCKQALDTNQVYKDLQSTTFKNDIDDNIELVTASVVTYFTEEGENWNKLQDKLNIIGNHNLNVVINYNENVNLIIKNNFRNEALHKIPDYIAESERLYADVDAITQQISENIVKKINDSKSKLRRGFNFSF